MLEAILIDVLYIIVIAVVIGVVFWALDTYGGVIPGPIRVAIKAIIVIAVLIFVIQFLFGVLPPPRALFK